MKRLSMMWPAFFLLPSLVVATEHDEPDIEPGFNAKTFEGLTMRGIGPAFMSGRIADIAIHPHNRNHWYVAVGSGGVWKTVNAGTTWTPVFESEGSYSIGAIMVDPNDPEIVWVGTGENVSGRHVGYGDGVYKSLDGDPAAKRRNRGGRVCRGRQDARSADRHGVSSAEGQTGPSRCALDARPRLPRCKLKSGA